MQGVLLRTQHALRTQSSCVIVRRGVGSLFLQSLPRTTQRQLSQSSRRQKAVATVEAEDANPVNKVTVLRMLPVTCPGCGALSQTVDSSSAGYYGEKQERVQDDRRKQEDAVFAAAFARGGLDDMTVSSARPKVDRGTPICDRCHYLQYQSMGRSIVHPTTDSIRAIIDESPHRNNHIYHVLDAADFPMSLIPNLASVLRLPKLRTQNRRSKSIRYMRDRIADITFVITRSDLLAPKKDQVDALMPYVQEVLRDALGRSGQNARLGNIRLVSSKRGWWTTTVKEEIYKRGGAGWMVGKVNVGKSALVEVVYPKGRMDTTTNIAKLREEANKQLALGYALDVEQKATSTSVTDGEKPDLTAAEIADVEATMVTTELPADSLYAYTPNVTSEGSLIDGKALNAPIQPAHSADVTDQPKLQNDRPAVVAQPDDAFTRQDFDNEPDEDLESDILYDETDNTLLPPIQPEVEYPTMPLVSALPGTTASPIRLPFGNGKGELIDLPGIQRSTLDTFVKEECRKEMIMKHRIVPEQMTVKPGQSLLLGGLVRITPKTEDLIFLMYGFLPPALKPHITSTEKAIAIQTGSFAESGEQYDGNVPSNATEAAKLSVKSAGSFRLRWDVTKQRAGPVTDKVAGKQKPSTLPYIVYALDLLIEGVGWVEVVAQVRRKKVMEASLTHFSDPYIDDAFSRHESHLPEVEVFSPKGNFVGVRRPLNGWILGGPKKTPVHKQRARPRQSMSYHRRVEGGMRGSRLLNS